MALLAVLHLAMRHVRQLAALPDRQHCGSLLSAHRRHVGHSAVLILLRAVGQAVVFLHHPAGNHCGTLGTGQGDRGADQKTMHMKLSESKMAFPAAGTAAGHMHPEGQHQHTAGCLKEAPPSC